MTPILSGAHRASRQPYTPRSSRLAIATLLVAVAATIGLPAPPPAAAASTLKVAVIVGPAGSRTATYRAIADQAAAEARKYTSNVVRVYSPNATWSRVKSAMTGASIVVYVGRGLGYPTPRSSTFRPSTQDGFGLNPVAGVNNSTVRWYGESYVKGVRLAPRAVVLLYRARYAPGASESGYREPTLTAARKRVDNYGAGFISAGAAGVIAELTSTPVWYIRTIFTKDITLDAMWRVAPTRNGHVTAFTSTRRAGATGRVDPAGKTTGYERSIIGRLSMTTTDVRDVTSLPGAAPPPVVSGIPVPSTIDATGATDVSATLISWLRGVPDGSTVVFKSGGTYRLGAAIKFSNRHDLTFEGNGATLRSSGGTTEASSLFWLGSYGGINTGITIRNFTLAGNSTTPGVYQSGQEGAHGILVAGGSSISISNVTVRGVWGDCLYVGAWADGVTFRDSTCESNGRNGVTVTAGRNLTVQRVAFPKSGYCTFDIEPNLSTEGASNIRFLDNTAGTWTNSFLSAEGAPGSVVSGVTVSGNTVTNKSLETIIQLSTRRQNIVFTNNVSKVAAAGPVLWFAYIDGLTVTGNVQPLSSGSVARILNSTNVVYVP